MFNIKSFGDPPVITYKDKGKNEVTISVNSGKNNKEIVAVVVSPAVASAIQEANSRKK